MTRNIALAVLSFALLVCLEGAYRPFLTVAAAPHGRSVTVSGQIRLRMASSSVVQHVMRLSQIPEDVTVDAQTGRTFLLTYPTGAGPRHVMVLATRTGALVHIVSLPGPLAALVVATTTQRVFVISGQTIRLLDARSGLPLPPIVLACESPQSLAADALARRVYVGCADGSISTLDATTGAVLRTLGLGGTLTIIVHARTGHVVVVGQDPTSGRSLRVSMLAASTGALLHTSPIAAPPQGHAVGTGGEHVFVLAGNAVRMIDARTGWIVHTTAVSIDPWTLLDSMAVGRVYVLTGAYFDAEANPNEPGTVSVLDDRTGAVVRTVTLGKAAFAPSPAAIALDPSGRHVWVLSTNKQRVGGITRLNALTGQVEQTVYPAANALPVAIAIDSKAGRLIEADAVFT